MNEKLVKKLLGTKVDDEFLKILFNEKIEFDLHRELWDERVIEHLLSISNLTRQEFEQSFYQEPPVDDFDEEW